LRSTTFIGLLVTQFLGRERQYFRWLVIGIGKEYVDKQHISASLVGSAGCLVLPCESSRRRPGIWPTDLAARGYRPLQAGRDRHHGVCRRGHSGRQHLFHVRGGSALIGSQAA
jgi:hypothetical protein